MKRSAASNSKKTHIPSDFKRLKAKVGKRAPKKLNTTDTSFQTATVQVRAQSIAVATATNTLNNVESNKHIQSQDDSININSLKLLPSRGKTISQHIAVLHHHAPAVRNSALQSIREVIQLSTADKDRNVASLTIQAHLSTLIPAISKCFVDEDDKVRQMSISLLFQDITSKLTLLDVDSSPNEITSVYKLDQGKLSMKPFLRLILAYITSALNSLDEDIRYDGCNALELLCSQYGFLVHDEQQGDPNNNSNVLSLLYSTLPTFIQLLNDFNGGTVANDYKKMRNDSKKKKRKNDSYKDIHDSKPIGVLQSLIMTLKTIHINPAFLDSVEENCDDDVDLLMMSPSLLSSPLTSKHVDFTYIPGSRRGNAIILKSNTSNNDDFSNRSCKVLRRLTDLTVFTPDNHESTLNLNPNLNLNKNQCLLPISTQIQLLSKLRDRFVEVTQHGHSNGGDNSGISISLGYVKEMSLLISALRLLWLSFSKMEIINLLQYNHTRLLNTPDADKNIHNIVHLENDMHLKSRKKLMTIGSVILNLNLECLPVKDDSGNPTNKLTYNLLNAGLCCLLSEYGSFLNVNSSQYQNVEADIKRIYASASTTKWVDAVFSYILPRLKSEESSISSIAADGITDNALTNRSNFNHNIPILKIIGQLLLKQESTMPYQHSTLLDNERKQMELLNTFTYTYFKPESDETIQIELMNSKEGRRAVILLLSLVMQHFDNRANNIFLEEDESKWCANWALYSNALLKLLDYLREWRASYPKETVLVLSMLIFIARKYDSSTNCEPKKSINSPFVTITNDFCQSVQEKIPQFFSKIGKYYKFGNKGCKRFQLSIFEILPEYPQKLLINLVGLLHLISNDLLVSLGDICARRHSLSDTFQMNDDYHVSYDMVDYIMSVIHSLRMMMPMQIYLTFVIQSCGINDVKYENIQREADSDTSIKDNSVEAQITCEQSSTKQMNNVSFSSKDIDFITSYDKCLSKICRYLIDCNSKKVLNMLSPILQTWLQYDPESEDVHSQRTALFRSRSSLTIISCCALDVTLMDRNCSDLIELDVFQDVPDLKVQITNFICDVIFRLNLARNLFSDEDAMLLFSRLVSPIIALFSCQASLLNTVIKKCCIQIENKIDSLDRNESIINSLLYLIRSKKLSVSLYVHDVSLTLVRCAESVENVLRHTSLDILAGIFRSEVNALYGLDL